MVVCPRVWTLSQAPKTVQIQSSGEETSKGQAKLLKMRSTSSACTCTELYLLSLKAR